MATTSVTADVTRLYIGCENRAPDPDGQSFWINGFTRNAVADDLSRQGETRATDPFFEKEEPIDVDGSDMPAGNDMFRVGIWSGADDITDLSAYLF